MLAQIAMTTSGRSLSPSTPLYAAAEPLSSRIETTPKQPRNTDAATRFEHEPPHKPAQEAGANTPFSPTGTTRQPATPTVRNFSLTSATKFHFFNLRHVWIVKACEL
ncbi:unnamed protein product [Vicia faba]|uniref:Uncharacterized protein n=1 Tax=Vicia faba TaxID=3906 RepID=A0AAV1AW62_VICFA|nr:unnamed protein product [Vicia faba]